MSRNKKILRRYLLLAFKMKISQTNNQEDWKKKSQIMFYLLVYSVLNNAASLFNSIDNERARADSKAFFILFFALYLLLFFPRSLLLSFPHAKNKKQKRIANEKKNCTNSNKITQRSLYSPLDFVLNVRSESEFDFIFYHTQIT